MSDKSQTTRAVRTAWLIMTLLVFYTSSLNFADRQRAWFLLPSFIGGQKQEDPLHGIIFPGKCAYPERYAQALGLSVCHVEKLQ